MGENTLTKERHIIDNVVFESTMGGMNRRLTKEEKEDILKKIGRGSKSGIIESDIFGRWKLSRLAKVGDRVMFSTSGKYNPGFTLTKVYEGEVIEADDHSLMVKTDKGIASILQTHVEKIIEGRLV